MDNDHNPFIPGPMTRRSFELVIETARIEREFGTHSEQAIAARVALDAAIDQAKAEQAEADRRSGWNDRK